jgi:predicted nuclease with TOPRIM domain
VVGRSLFAQTRGNREYDMEADAIMFNAQERIDQLEAENAQLREDIDFLAAERANERKNAERLEEQIQTLRVLYEAEADTANDLSMEVARLNKVLKEKKK